MKHLVIIIFIFSNIICFAQTNDNETELLAEKYYRDFINPTVIIHHDLVEFSGEIERDSIKRHYDALNFHNKPSVYSNSAELAFDNLLKLWNENIEKRESIYHAIVQLGCFLKKDTKHIKRPDTNSYFPADEFTNLKINWQCDYTIDYLYEMEFSKLDANQIEKHLKALEEPNLFLNKSDAYKIYRFTWLRSFHDPIIVRLEDNNDNYTIYWKVGDGRKFKLKSSGCKKISKKEWEIFESLISRENYINIRQNQSMAIHDGAKWLLEEKTLKDYRTKLTHKPKIDFFRSCMYLIKLTGLEIPESETY